MTDGLDKPIGKKEQTKLTAGSVIVSNVAIEAPKEGSKAKIVNVYCKHPDKEEPIKISSVMLKMVQGNNITIKCDTLWYHEDSEGNVVMRSCVAELLRFYKKETLRNLIGSVVNTEQNASGYLAIKAY